MPSNINNDQSQYVRLPTDDRKPIKPNPPRWEPSDDPDAIIVPGLDTNASVNDQIDYIEQLVTVKLQNVDENMAKIHHLLSSRMLPAFKNYAVGTEPVREAAKFWVNFFEKAARVRLPIYDELSTAQEQTIQHDQETEPTETETETESHTHSEGDVTAQPDSFNPDRTPSESSFMPGQGAVSSTPAAFSRHRSEQEHESQDSFASQASEDAPWARSLESPLVRLDRELRSLSVDDVPPGPPPYGEPSVYLEPSDRNDHSQARLDKGKSREVSEPLLYNVLRSGLRNKNEVNSANPPSARAGPTSPLKFRRKPPTPKAFNPFLPPQTKPEQWNGIVDLKKTPLTTSRHQGYSSGLSGPKALEEDDEDMYPPGMSPLTTIQLPTIARPTLGRSPSKEAAKKIGRDLISDAQRRGGKGTTESSLSSMPTPPSLQRYTRDGYEARRGPVSSEVSSSGMDTSLESLMRRVGLSTDYQGQGGSTTISAPSYVPPSTASRPVFSVQPLHEEEEQYYEEPHTPEPAPYVQDDDTVMQGQAYQEDLDDSFDSFDSFDEPEINDTAHPSAAFLMASSQRGPHDLDDSFDDSFDDDDGDERMPPVIPFDDGDDWFDDSLDDDGPTETIFGAHRYQGGGQAPMQLGMRGEQLLEDTVGIGDQLARAGRLPRSPTVGPGVEDASMLA
ncbi:hypothetical protein NEOLEDRAFT_1180751 [Neolentinus lepideus HHB14362 ss-1]|uniref:DASH complex subunit ASK1 n=1 Tax=Neolentinus lepideus HHB14362 ss-1 TaxID=1314782 RepID=A0A165QNU4_9AGAM|nr:hypothetical protein NEOLEDRAFT_1180751 [Neolentinus lepideus HHB14362 ss-1]